MLQSWGHFQSDGLHTCMPSTEYWLGGMNTVYAVPPCCPGLGQRCTQLVQQHNSWVPRDGCPKYSNLFPVPDCKSRHKALKNGQSVQLPFLSSVCTKLSVFVQSFRMCPSPQYLCMHLYNWSNVCLHKPMYALYSYTLSVLHYFIELACYWK